jgi:hypothetical protein
MAQGFTLDSWMTMNRRLPTLPPCIETSLEGMMQGLMLDLQVLGAVAVVVVEMGAGSMLLRHTDLHGFIYILFKFILAFLFVHRLYLVFLQNLYYILLQHYKQPVGRVGGPIGIYRCLRRTVPSLRRVIKYALIIMCNGDIRFDIHMHRSLISK